jgi:hypothetical protein
MYGDRVAVREPPLKFLELLYSPCDILFRILLSAPLGRSYSFSELLSPEVSSSESTSTTLAAVVREGFAGGAHSHLLT